MSDLAQEKDQELVKPEEKQRIFYEIRDTIHEIYSTIDHAENFGAKTPKRLYLGRKQIHALYSVSSTDAELRCSSTLLGYDVITVERYDYCVMEQD